MFYLGYESVIERNARIRILEHPSRILRRAGWRDKKFLLPPLSGVMPFKYITDYISSLWLVKQA